MTKLIYALTFCFIMMFIWVCVKTPEKTPDADDVKKNYVLTCGENKIFEGSDRILMTSQGFWYHDHSYYRQKEGEVCTRSEQQVK